MSDITPEDITKHISQFLAGTYSDILVVGNLDKEVCTGVKWRHMTILNVVHNQAASTYAEMAEDIIGSKSISSSAVSDAGLVLPEGKSLLHTH